MPVNLAFERAMVRVFHLEGGEVDHPADRGGVTKFGVSLAYLKSLGADRGGDIDLDGDVDAADVLAVTPEKARALFRRDFWIPSGADDASTISEAIATKLFEFSLVAGPGRAVRALQRALCDTRSPVDVDGRYGEQTHGALILLNGAGLMGELRQALRRRCAEHFLGIVVENRSQIVFLVGWLRRALDLDEGAA